MEYLMTYGWAILVIAIIVSLLFALGLFSGGAGTPSGCVPQSGFSCTNPSYGTNGISATISQDSGQYYLNAWVFVVSSGEHISSSGLPVNFSTSNTANMLYIGELGPSQSATFYFKNISAAAIPTANIPVGYPFSGYIWMGYCTTPGCAAPTSFTKVATLNLKATGSAFEGGSQTTGSTTTTTSTISTSIAYVEITLSNGQSTQTPATFQQNITIDSASYASYINANWSNVEFTVSAAAANGGTPVEAWVQSGANNTGSAAVVWVKLTSAIASGGNTIVYMNFMPTNAPMTSGLTGFAPQQISGAQKTYGQYDNGAKVFNFYDNFSGNSNSVPSGFSSYNNSITVDNGLLLVNTASESASFHASLFETTAQYGVGTAFDVYYAFSVASDTENIGYLSTPYASEQSYYGTYIRQACGNTYADQANTSAGEPNSCGGTSKLFSSEQLAGVYSISIINNTESYQQLNNVAGLFQPENKAFPQYPLSVGFSSDNNGDNMAAQWIRVRNIPPLTSAGVPTMPAVSFSQVKTS